MFLLLVILLYRPCSEVKWNSTGYTLPLPCVTVCSQISTGLYNNYMYTENAQNIGFHTGLYKSRGGHKVAAISCFLQKHLIFVGPQCGTFYVAQNIEVCREFFEKIIVRPHCNVLCTSHSGIILRNIWKIA